jgi:ADP-ribose pyrophosphatase
MKKWQLVGAAAVLTTPWITVKKKTYRVGESEDDYFVVERSPFVLVLASDQSRLVLVKQYRPAVDSFLYSLPAGYLENGEAPEAAARRELLEEAGVDGDGLRLIGQLDPLPGYIKSRAFIVACRVNGECSIRDRDEITSVELVEVERVLQMISEGAITEMQTAAAVLLGRLKGSI